MKRLLSFFISLLLLGGVMVAAIACDDEDGGALTGLTYEQAAEKIAGLPASTDGKSIEKSINEVFGTDIDLPDGTYSAQNYSIDGHSAYMVEITGASVSAADYYAEIKEDMLKKGWVAEESEHGFAKVVGNVVYALAVEEDDGKLYISMGVSDPAKATDASASGEYTPSTASESASQSTPTSGELSAWPTATVNTLFATWLPDGIPAFTAGSSYTVEAHENSASLKRIKILCYGVTDTEKDTYIQTLRDAGFRAAVSLVYEHNDLDWSNIVCSSSYHEGRQEMTITFYAECYSSGSSGSSGTSSSSFSFAQLPTNLKMTIEQGSGGIVERRTTMIKLSEDYLVLSYPYDGTAISESWTEAYYLRKTTNGWQSYSKSATSDWVEGGVITSLDSYSPLSYIKHIFNNDISGYTQEQSVQLAGQTCTVYTKESSVTYGGTVYYTSANTVCLNAAGFVMKYSSDMTYSGSNTSVNASLIQVLLWDTTVTSFGVTIP